MKKDNEILWIIGIIVAAVFLVKYSSLFAILGIGQIDSTSTTVLSNLPEKTIYAFSYAVSDNSQGGGAQTFSESDPLTIEFQVPTRQNHFNMPPGTGQSLQSETFFYSLNNNIVLTLFTNYQNPNQQVQQIILEPEVKCKVGLVGPLWSGGSGADHVCWTFESNPEIFPDYLIDGIVERCDNGRQKYYRPDITCDIKGKLNCPANSSPCAAKVNSGSIDVEIYRQGFTQSITVYRNVNNQCTAFTVNSYEVQPTDFLVLSDCEETLVECVANSDCGSGEICSSNVCIPDNSIPPNSTGNNTCTPNWNCSSFSSCTNSVQTRTCTDLNSCNNLTGRPALNQSCSVSTPTQNASNNSTSTPVQQPDKEFSWIIIIIPVVGIILGIYLWRKKK